MATKVHEYSATGRRKTSVARVRLAAGDGKFIVNKREFTEYFPLETLRRFAQLPLALTNNMEKFDIKALVSGGGLSGQSGAIHHGIARALIMADAATRPVLKSAGCLTRDPRMKERKKSGQPGARKRFQFSKR